MTGFLLLLVLLAIPVVAVLPALLNRSSIAVDNSLKQNTRIASERLSEIDNITDEARQEAEIEVKASLLEDTASNDHLPDKIISPRHSIWIPVFLVLFSVSIYQYLGSPEYLFGIQQAGLELPGPDPKPDISKMIEQLETQIAISPDNARAWELAGQSYMVINEFSKAAASYRSLNHLVPDNPDYLIAWADASIMAAGDIYTETAQMLVARALKINPEHESALWLSALGESSIGNFEDSTKQLQILLTRVSDDEAMSQQLKTMIEQNRSMLISSGNQAAVQPAQPTKKSITITARVMPGLRDNIPESAVVFIIAKALNGPPAPLAVKRFQVADLPLTVTLTQQDSMIAGLDIDSFDQISLQARISRSGTAETVSGDLASKPATVTGKEPHELELLIDSVIP